MMQGDYYGFNQGPPQAFSHVGFFQPFGYSIGSSIPSNRNVEKLKKSKLRHLESRKHEDVTNSTDESIHLVSSRKTGESAPNRYDGEHMKKRSQSGNSIGKNSDLNDIDSNPQRNRSQSEEGSISPNNIEETQSRTASANRNSNETSSSKGKSKKKRERRIKKSPLNYDIENHLLDNMYIPNNQQFIVQQAGYGIEIQRPPVHYPGQEVWPGEYGGVAPSQVHQPQAQQQYVLPEQQYYPGAAWPGQAYDIAPGGPVSAVEYTYGQIPQQNVQYDPNVAYNQSYYPIDPAYQQGIPMEPSMPSQSYGPVPESSQPVGYIPGLPPGAKIVAEYFLGYLDEQQANQSHPSHHSQQQLQQLQPLQPLQPINPYQQAYQYPVNTQQSIVNQLHSQQPLQPYQPCPPSHSSKEDVEIEVWEKSKKKKQEDDYYDDNKICKAKVDDDDLKRLKEDIINTIQKELGNLKINAPSHIHHHTTTGGSSSDSKQQEPIQPIFLMPKPSEQPAPKPIYIPRNIYVPVIRPVFVPRERIIVRPQIIHVARPVLVDRPVPVQQRPIVIERDRPVPVRVETVERTETIGGGGEVTRNIETGQEVTYHEFSQNYPSGNNTGEYANQQFTYQQNQYNDQVDYEENRRKQEVLNILEEAERRKQALQSKSNDDVGQYKYSKYDNASENNKTLDSLIGNTQGYTLEVLDQRVSDKFERTDQETIKARYGVDSFQYLPSGELNTQQNRTTSNNFGQIANNNEYYTNAASQGVANNEYYSNTTSQNLGTSGSYKNLASATEARRSTSNIYNANYGGDSTTPYGTITNVTQIPSPGSRGVNQSQAPVVIQNVQKMIQNFGPGYPDQPNSSSIIIEN